jgi:hypothetical protein
MKPLALILITLLSTGSTAFAAEDDVQEMAGKMSGFQKVETKEACERFLFRDQGDFIISKAGFSNRADAVNFCKSMPGYELSDWLLPGIMTMSGLPLSFNNIRKNNVIDFNVLDGSNTLSGEARSGLIFWVKGKTAEEEAQFSKGTDVVYTMLNGCGPNCEDFESLAEINTKLKLIGQAPVAPLAICTSKTLQENLDKN